ncbi:MAG: DUF2270 domain-containing protein [Gemmatimonadota bacterium]
MDYHNPPQILVHFYRASVQHADVWRQRLDATTNWAVVTTAAVITFSFGGPDSAHFVVLMALVFDVFFLFMEARRYQTYNLWQGRVRVLHRFLVAPALADGGDFPQEVNRAQLVELAADLGKNLPVIPLWGALGYRIRRNYGPLVTLVILTWMLKLYIFPRPANDLHEYAARAAIGHAPGPYVFLLLGIFLIAFIVLAVKAPTERMKNWSALPAPIDRILPLGKKPAAVGGIEDVPPESPRRRTGAGAEGTEESREPSGDSGG